MAASAQYLALLATTLAIELPLVAALAGRGRRRDVLLAGLALNLLTHPVAFALAWLVGAPWIELELVVLAGEALGYHALARVTWPRALTLSALANGASALLALALHAA